ncbi:hypothetical protein T492DRAFT_598144, partial [Pavlovales sp. CCMP2436]
MPESTNPAPISTDEITAAIARSEAIARAATQVVRLAERQVRARRAGKEYVEELEGAEAVPAAALVPKELSLDSGPQQQHQQPQQPPQQQQPPPPPPQQQLLPLRQPAERGQPPARTPQPPRPGAPPAALPVPSPVSDPPALAGSGSGSGEEDVDEADELCCVCGTGDSEEANLIVFCNRCDLAVHQVCYAVQRVPAGDWLCDRCDQPAEAAEAVRCAVCP